MKRYKIQWRRGLSMGFIFSPFAGRAGDRNEVRQNEAATQLVTVKTTGPVLGDVSLGVRPVGAESTGGMVEIAYPRRLQAPEQEPRSAGGDAASAGIGES